MAEQESYPDSDRIEGFPHPRTAPAIFGQDKAATEFLQAWRAGRLHHAWLLRGPHGIGKATLAYRIARALLAQPPVGDGLFGDGPVLPKTLDAPADCPVQARIEAQSEPRLFVLRREYDIDKKRFQTRIVVENVRRLRQFLGLSSADGGWRAIIVDPADDMNPNSANALLKLLEEPPAMTIFLLVCHAPAALLPTIRSRCRTLDLSPLGAEAMAWALTQAGAEISRDETEPLTTLAAGSVGQALTLSTGGGLQIYAGLLRLFEDTAPLDRAGMTAMAESCAGRANDQRYRLTIWLIQTLLARLARTAATGQAPPGGLPGEAALSEAIANHPAQAAAWAEALTRISETTRHAMAVNLDPAQCVLDTLLEIDATLGRVRALAA